jgi:hypothetical protein
MESLEIGGVCGIGKIPRCKIIQVFDKYERHERGFRTKTAITSSGKKEFREGRKEA